MGALTIGARSLLELSFLPHPRSLEGELISPVDQNPLALDDAQVVALTEATGLVPYAKRERFVAAVAAHYCSMGSPYDMVALRSAICDAIAEFAAEGSP
jgi:hypothetical protein